MDSSLILYDIKMARTNEVIIVTNLNTIMVPSHSSFSAGLLLKVYQTVIFPHKLPNNGPYQIKPK
jgi:hypothetical protein